MIKPLYNHSFLGNNKNTLKILKGTPNGLNIELKNMLQKDNQIFITTFNSNKVKYIKNSAGRVMTALVFTQVHRRVTAACCVQIITAKNKQWCCSAVIVSIVR